VTVGVFIRIWGWMGEWTGTHTGCVCLCWQGVHGAHAHGFKRTQTTGSCVDGERDDCVPAGTHDSCGRRVCVRLTCTARSASVRVWNVMSASPVGWPFNGLRCSCTHSVDNYNKWGTSVREWECNHEQATVEQLAPNRCAPGQRTSLNP
jgi:hypothetical protein